MLSEIIRNWNVAMGTTRDQVVKSKIINSAHRNPTTTT